MSRVSLRRPSIAAAALAPVFAACSSATDPTPKALSATEARAVTDALVEQVFGAVDGDVGLVSSRGVTPHDAALARLRALRPARTRPAASSPLTIALNEPCPLGGTIIGSATVSENLDANDTGTVSGRVTVAPRACVVSAGSRNVTVNGAPAVTIDLAVPIVQNEWVSAATLRVGGAFSYTGGTCALAYTITLTPSRTGSVAGTVAGTICGHAVSGSFSGEL